MLALTTPFPQFYDLDGSPLSAGYLYIGEVNQNPIAKPISVFWDEDGTIPAAQPIRTINGVPANIGTPALIYTPSAYSLTVKNKSLQQVFYAANAATFSNSQVIRNDLANNNSGMLGAGQIGYLGSLPYPPGTIGYEMEQRVLDVQQRLPVVATIALLRARSELLSPLCMATGYYASGDGGGGLYCYDATDSTSADNGGTVIVAADGGRWKLTYTGEVSIKQFGARTDGVDCAAQIQAAITWATTTRGHGLWVPDGTYKINTPIVKASSFIGLSMRGAAANSVIFDFSSIPDSSVGLQMIGGSGGQAHGDIYGITLIGNSTTILAEFSGQDGHWFRNCVFGMSATGIRFHNAAAGSFTEYCGADGCEFQGVCATPVEYKVTSGNVSFHGSGLRNRCLINTPSAAGAVMIKVGVGCLVYNAPLDCQVWVNGVGCTLIQNNNNGTPFIFNNDWHGTLTIENFSTIVTIATGWVRTFFVGTVQSNTGQTINYGVFKPCDAFFSTNTGTALALPKQTTRTGIALTTGANLLDITYFPTIGLTTGSGTGMVVAYVHLSGPNYEYGIMLGLELPAGGGTGNATIICLMRQFNSSGWGVPAFGLTAAGQLSITNANYPASGVFCSVALSSLGWDQPQ